MMMMMMMIHAMIMIMVVAVAVVVTTMCRVQVFFVFHALCIYHHTFPTLAAQDIQVEACRVADERPWAGHPKVSNIIIYRLEIIRCRHLLPLPAPYLFLEIRGLWV